MQFRVRPLLRQLHLWLGLGIGLPFVLLGLTGSALVFYVGVDELLHPETHAAGVAPPPGWASPVWDRALATGRAHSRDLDGIWSFEVSGEPGAIPARYYPPAHGSDHHPERIMVWFSADGSHILRADPWGGYLMSWLYKLHMQLLAGETGRQIVGWAGVAALFLLMSGVVVWWPRGSLNKALAFKPYASPIRRLRDIHKLAGLSSIVFLFILAATGAFLALPDFKASMLTATVVAPDPLPSPKSTAIEGEQIAIIDALTIAHHAVPDARLAFIDVPGAGDGTFKLRIQVPGDPHRRFPGSYVFVDQYSGRVLAVHDIRRGNASTGINAWIRVLHDGSIGGLATRILTIVIGLVPALLYITGLLHWRRRANARAKMYFKNGEV